MNTFEIKFRDNNGRQNTICQVTKPSAAHACNTANSMFNTARISQPDRNYQSYTVHPMTNKIGYCGVYVGKF